MLPDLRAAVDEVQQALRQAGGGERLGEELRRVGRPLARLPHARVADHQRDDAVDDHLDGEVPRRDEGGHADRLVDRLDAAVGVLGAPRRRGAAAEAARVLDRRERDGDRHVGDHLVARLSDRLAHLDRDPAADLLGAGLDRHHGVDEDLGAPCERYARPRALRLARGGDGGVDLLGTRVRHARDDGAVRGADRLLDRPVAVHPRAVDEAARGRHLRGGRGCRRGFGKDGAHGALRSERDTVSFEGSY